MPTEKCNFRCTYCYEKFEKGRMSDELITGVKRFLEFEIDRLPFYSLGWFGGEPLLQPRIIHSVTKHFHRIQETSGSQGSVAITTNGSLLKGEALKLMKDADRSLPHFGGRSCGGSQSSAAHYRWKGDICRDTRKHFVSPGLHAVQDHFPCERSNRQARCRGASHAMAHQGDHPQVPTPSAGESLTTLSRCGTLRPQV